MHVKKTTVISALGMFCLALTSAIAQTAPATAPGRAHPADRRGTRSSAATVSNLARQFPEVDFGTLAEAVDLQARARPVVGG